MITHKSVFTKLGILILLFGQTAIGDADVVSQKNKSTAACVWEAGTIGQMLYIRTDRRLYGERIKSHAISEQIKNGIYTSKVELYAPEFPNVSSRVYQFKIKFEYYQKSDGTPICSETLSIETVNL
jgi:hypothetical protein